MSQATPAASSEIASASNNVASEFEDPGEDQQADSNIVEPSQIDKAERSRRVRIDVLIRDWMKTLDNRTDETMNELASQTWKTISEMEKLTAGAIKDIEQNVSTDLVGCNEMIQQSRMQLKNLISKDEEMRTKLYTETHAMQVELRDKTIKTASGVLLLKGSTAEDGQELYRPFTEAFFKRDEEMHNEMRELVQELGRSYRDSSSRLRASLLRKVKEIEQERQEKEKIASAEPLEPEDI